jgi:hypothetical protein
MKNLEPEQKEVCRRFGVVYESLDFNLKLGVSDNFFSGALPLNGLRHIQEPETCGWYLWAGEEFSEDADFFKPLHVYHLLERTPEVLKYLALPEGWRFLVAGEYEDVWFDEKLLEGYDKNYGESSA